MQKIDDIIKHFDMLPHPEGGYYKETYRSNLNIDTPKGKRSASTAIYFLITKDSISHFHRLSSDEGWHYYMGDPLIIFEITPKGEYIETILGPDLKSGHKYQYIVPAGHWFGSTSLGHYSLVGCTVSPGFDFADFEMAKFNTLSKEFPKLRDICAKYCLD